jgi:quercetin dioxygenase-like cupin family protein
MSNLKHVSEFPLLAIWGEAVRARRVQGDRITLAVVELAPDAVVPEHRHDNEQLGLCIEGSGTFTIDGERREIRPGSTWRILGGLPHDLAVGPEGAVVIDVFAPVRDDWDDREVVPGATPLWPKG